MVNQQIKREPNGHYFLGVARITRLDEINRTLGLARSDRLLKYIAQQMTDLATAQQGIHKVIDKSGREECVYQISGDSFGLLIKPDTLKDNFKNLEASLTKLSEPAVLDNLAIDLHPIFGVSIYPKHGDNAAMLIRNAHVGMKNTPHAVKKLGFYSQKYDIYSESRLTQMSDLREALLLNQTELFYQPKINLVTGEIVGLEALIRWPHPERGWIFPNDFIPLAEETGVITLLTRWAFQQGIKDLADLLNDYPRLSLSINISARDLAFGDLNNLIETTLKQYQIDTSLHTI